MMNNIKKLRLSICTVRLLQCCSNATPSLMPKRYFYSKKKGVPREFITFLTQDYDFSVAGLKKWIEKSKWKDLKEDHKFVPERHRMLGPDLAAANFLVKRGAKVKFVGRNNWFQQDKDGNMSLPTTYIHGLHIEAIDATKMQWSYVAFDNMIDLEHLRYLKFSKCKNFDNWSLARLYQYADSLEFLDISDCPDVTQNGLACLHNLKNLQGLNLGELPNVENLGLMVLLLEENLPACTIFGLNDHQLQVPAEESNIQAVVEHPSQGADDNEFFNIRKR